MATIPDRRKAFAWVEKLSLPRLDHGNQVTYRVNVLLRRVWRSKNGGGCLVGSANFTSAALDGRNVEVCLLLSKADELVDSLFDRQLNKRPLALDEFVPGDAEAPESEVELPPLRINSALLTQANQLRVSYSHQLEPPPTSLRLTIRTPGETRPRASMNIPKKSKATETVSFPESALADAHGTLLAELIAEVEGEKIESSPVWVIQESRLTYEPGEGSSSSKGKIEDTGEGLPEFLDELGKREGVAAVVDYEPHVDRSRSCTLVLALCGDPVLGDFHLLGFDVAADEGGDGRVRWA